MYHIQLTHPEIGKKKYWSDSFTNLETLCLFLCMKVLWMWTPLFNFVDSWCQNIRKTVWLADHMSRIFCEITKCEKMKVKGVFKLNLAPLCKIVQWRTCSIHFCQFCVRLPGNAKCARLAICSSLYYIYANFPLFILLAWRLISSWFC